MASINTHILITILLLFSTTCYAADDSNLTMTLECLNVNSVDYIVSLKELEDKLNHTGSLFQQKNVSFLHSNTISSCINLYELSNEELGSSIENLKYKHSNTSVVCANLRMRLNAIMANGNICLDQLKGTNSNGLISTSINELNSFVSDLLVQVKLPTPLSGHFIGQDQLPPWIESEDVSSRDFRIADVVVAADGTGNFTRVTDALLSAPLRSTRRYVIHVKKGVYNEHVIVDRDKSNIVMIGDGMDATIITGSLSEGHDHVGTPNTATFSALGSGFIAQYMSFENTAGAVNRQAVALLSSSDQSVFYRCGISGYQDSLFAFSGRQYYRECKICGSADFIFGSAAAVFQYCQILVRKGLTQQNTITAQGGPYRNQNFGFTFQFCNISADLDLIPHIHSIRTYLGRPWQPYSKTIFMECQISEVVDPEGWLKWGGTDYAQDTLFYAEYKNYGLGAGVQNRVKWPGYHVFTDPKQALNFTVAHLISGYYWLPSTGVPFTPYFGGGKNTKGK